MNNTIKKFGKKKASSWGRLKNKFAKRVAGKAARRFKLKEDKIHE